MEDPSQQWHPIETEHGIYVPLSGGDMIPVHDMEEGYELIEFLTLDIEKNASNINAHRNGKRTIRTQDTGNDPAT